ncbi:MAG: ABC transporter permease, partial [Flavobacteriales bacterium]|nr:ABC transporter permease [Flavobacteriales bacterium]
MFNIGYYISRRIYKKDGYHGNISSTVLKIAISAISIGMIVMLIALCTGLGLQKQIQENVASFAGHIQVSAMGQTSSFSSSPIVTREETEKNIAQVNGVTHIQKYATRAGIVKTDEDFEGVVIKGIGDDYKYSSFSPFVIKGSIPHFGNGDATDSIVISQSTASKLKINTSERIKVYFVRENGTPTIRYFTVAGVYKTGISDFDDVYALGDIRSIQQLNRWDENQVSGLEITLEHSSQMPKASQEIFVQTQGQYSVTTIADTHADILDWVAMFDVNIWVIIAIMTIVCGVNMITVLLILILEKTTFIGLLKSMG